MFKSRRSQAALEYLVTYGWAFLVILGTISVLGYFGFLNPDKYIPNSCEFGEQLVCVDQYMDSSGVVVFRFKNNYEADIVLDNAFGDDIIWKGKRPGGGDVSIGMGDIAQVQINSTKQLSEGSKERIRLSFEFHRDGGSVRHNVSGAVFGEVVEPLIS